MNSIAPTERVPLSRQLALRETPDFVWRTLVATTFRGVPPVVTLGALDFARTLQVPAVGGHTWPIQTKDGWQLAPGIQFYRLMAARAGTWAGLEWNEATELVAVGGMKLQECCECTALRFTDRGISRFPARVYVEECARRKSDGVLVKMWGEQPRKMLRVRAEMAALRAAFPEWTARDEVTHGRATMKPPTRRIIGMQVVVWELQQHLRLSQKRLAYRLNRSPSVVEWWMGGRCQPNRASTLQLLKLVREHRLGVNLENLCEQHLARIAEREARRRRIAEARAADWEARHPMAAG